MVVGAGPGDARERDPFARSSLISRFGLQERLISAFVNESRASGAPLAPTASAGAAP